MGEASHAGLSEVGELLGQGEGHAALQKRAPGRLPPLAQPGRLLLLLLLLAQGLQSQGTLQV